MPRSPRTRSLPFIFFAAALAGCQGGWDTGAPLPSGTLVDQQLVASAARIEGVFERLARIEQAHSPAMAPAVDETQAPAPLRAPLSWDWNGPIEPALRALAGRLGYRVVVHRLPPSIPVIVRVAAKDTPVIRIFEDIGLQATGRADVRVDAYRSVIDLYYAASGS